MNQDTLGYDPKEYKRFCRYGMGYLILFSLLYMCFYCCRLNLPNASKALIDAGFDKADIGILTSALFWTYGICQLFTGRLSETFGTTRFVILAVLLSAAVNFSMGFQSSLLAMTILWGVNGCFQSMAWVPGISNIARWFPGKRRGFAMGFADAFSGFGQGVATLSVAGALALLPAAGWKAAFWLPPLVPLAMLAVFCLFSKDSPGKVGLKDYVETNPDTAAAEAEMEALIKEKGFLYPYRYVLRNRTFVAWLIICFLVGLVRYGLVIWVPLYFVERFNINITAGLLQSLALPAGMGIGAITVPSLTDRFCPRNRLPAVMASAVAAAILIEAFTLVDPSSPAQLVLAEVLLFLSGFTVYSVCGTIWAFASDTGGRVFGGTCSGILNFGCYMGAAVQSIVYGFLLDQKGWTTVFFSIAAFCAVIALLAFFTTLAGRFGKNRKTEQ
ncbi:MAG: MFS transporter [Abditibacteriota bacterium]|nr:MFS transporter [Abditibacteriota bacterium]